MQGRKGRGDASKLRWRAKAPPGWSTRLACCFRRLAGNTAWRLRKHTRSPNLDVIKSARHSRTHEHRVSAASRLRQHASRVLHPEAATRLHAHCSALSSRMRPGSQPRPSLKLLVRVYSRISTRPLPLCSTSIGRPSFGKMLSVRALHEPSPSRCGCTGEQVETDILRRARAALAEQAPPARLPDGTRCTSAEKCARPAHASPPPPRTTAQYRREK